MTRGKADNRFQDRKHKEKTKRMIKEVWNEPEKADDEKFVGIEAGVHGARCSCPMCQTSRKNPWAKKDKLPAKERRDLLDAKEQIDETEKNDDAGADAK